MNRSLFLVNAFTLGLTGCMVSAGPPVVYASTAPPPPPPPATVGVTVTEDATLYPQSPPPDPVPEFAPASPGGGYVWVNGYWDWNGNDWIWSDGYWAPNRAGYVYFGPRFEFVDGRAVYYRSYWAGPGGVHEYGYGYGPRHEPPAAYRARPSQHPAQWRTQHNETWHQAPGAATWHGATAQHPGAEPQRQHAEPEHALPQHQGTPTAQAHLEGKGVAGAHGASEGSQPEHGEGAHPGSGPAAQNAPAAHPVGPHGAVPEKTPPQDHATPPQNHATPPQNHATPPQNHATPPQNHAAPPAAGAGHAQEHPNNAAPGHKKDKKEDAH